MSQHSLALDIIREYESSTIPKIESSRPLITSHALRGLGGGTLYQFRTLMQCTCQTPEGVTDEHMCVLHCSAGAAVGPASSTQSHSGRWGLLWLLISTGHGSLELTLWTWDLKGWKMWYFIYGRKYLLWQIHCNIHSKQIFSNNPNRMLSSVSMWLHITK